MPTTIGQHSVATFTSPVNGTTPIDANTVRGNDNTIRTSYNNHDGDPGIHVQSSALASRPVAGTAGRKWITADTGSYKLWYDDGTRWHEIGNDAVDIAVVADETLAKGDVLSITGFNNGLNLPRVAKYTGAAPAFAIAAEAIANGAQGYVINTGLINDIDTNAFGSIGTILYPAATGTFTATKPTSGTYQVVAYVLRQNTTNGALYVEFSAPRIVEASANTASTVVQRDASGNFSAGTITATLSGSITGNAATATALQTARTLWGRSFDGTANVTGALTSVTDITMTGNLSGAASVSATSFTGALTGNASTATALQTARTINGVSFNGTADITVTADAGTLTGSTLASGVTASSLTSVGTLSSLTVSGNVGIGVTPSAWSGLGSAFQFNRGSLVMGGVSNVDAYFSSNAFWDGSGWKYIGTASATQYTQNVTGDHRWYTAASGTAGNAVTFTERMRVDATATAGETALLLWDVDNGTLERVTVGAADSGGVGFKVLRIPN